VFGIPAPHKDLREFTTTENDMKKQTSRHPTNDYRSLSEDIFSVGDGSETSATKQMGEMSLST